MSDETWPDGSARRAFEAAMLNHHADTLAARYPETVWPRTEPAIGPRDSAVTQAAFVAGIRFACDQLRDAAADLADTEP